MAVFGHLCGLLVAFVIIKGSVGGVFETVTGFLNGLVSSSNPEAGGMSAFFTLPASLFLLLLYLLIVVLACQLPPMIVTKLIMDRDN